MTIGQRIRQRRESLGYKQIVVAMIAGCSLKTISDVENAKAMPRIDMAQRIAWALETTVGHLLGEIEGN